MWIVFGAILSSNAEKLVLYESPGTEEYWKQWEREDVLEDEAQKQLDDKEATQDPNSSNGLDSWLYDRGQWNERGHSERSDRWYDYPVDYLCVKSRGGNL
jgi:hypothetical protein